MDRNERLTYLDSRHVTESTKRVIQTVLDSYLTIRKDTATAANSSFYEERVEAVKNMLFLKYTSIEFESIFQSIYIDRKFET